MNRILWAIALAAVPAAAQANAGIGYFIVAVPFVLVALVPAVLLEACVLAPLLPVAPRRALALSFIANLRSSIWGIGLALVVDAALIGLSGSVGPEPTKASAIAALLPLFFFTWWIEHRAIRRLEPALPRSRVALVAGGANLLSYAALIAVIVMTTVLPERGAMPVRMRVGEAILAGNGARMVVDDYYRSKGRLPQNGEEAGYPRNTAPGGKLVSVIEIREQGVVVITLNKNEYWPEGGEIRLTRTADAEANTFYWKCSSTLPPKMVPATCRG